MTDDEKTSPADRLRARLAAMSPEERDAAVRRVLDVFEPTAEEIADEILSMTDQEVEAGLRSELRAQGIDPAVWLARVRAEVDGMLAARAAAAADDPSLTLDPSCPACHKHSGIGEAFDGSERDCDNCGEELKAVEWVDGTMTMVLMRPPRAAADLRSGRQRMRALWRRRGRR